MNDVKRVLVHLLNDQYDSAHAPNVTHVTDIHLRVNVELSAVHLTLLLRLGVQLLSLLPVSPYLLVLCILYQLVYYIIDFKANTVWFVSDNKSFYSVEIAYKAGL